MADDGMKKIDTSWITPDIWDRRVKNAGPYGQVGGGLEGMHEHGKITIKPAADRVLLRAILTWDASELGRGMAYDARQAIAHEIVALGPGVRAWEKQNGVERVEDGLQVGDHCFVVSAAADRLSKMDPTVRLWTARAAHIVAFWKP